MSAFRVHVRTSTLSSVKKLTRHSRYANVTLSERCITDNTAYLDVGPDGEQVANTVTRDNCQSPQFYCNPTSLVCEHTLPLSSPCQADLQCTSVRFFFFVLFESVLN